MASNEAQARLRIDEMLRRSKWILHDLDGEKPNVKVEMNIKSGRADYVLLDQNYQSLAVIEAKNPKKSALDGKEQARNYAKSLNLEFVILTNGEHHFLWNVTFGSPEKMDIFPTQEELISRRNWNPPADKIESIEIDKFFLAELVEPNIYHLMRGKNQNEQDLYLAEHQLKTLRYYQVEAVKAIAKQVTLGKSRFLLEMATGTGKTTTAAAIINLFMKTGNATKVLFLVDRIELEDQAIKSFKKTISVPNGFTCATYKEDRQNWQNVTILVSTIQSFIKNNRYEQIFTPQDFDLIITDEAHRCIGNRGRRVFEYFRGYKVGLTATPKDYLRGIDVAKTRITDSASLEKRELSDTYMIFDSAFYNSTTDSYDYQPAFRYDLIQGVKDNYLLMPVVIDSRTDKTTKILSEEGLNYTYIDETGQETTENIKRSDFEKTFFNENTNIEFCRNLIESAKRDPLSGEVGKTIVFTVSQAHASKITQILNRLADEYFPNKYQSDFAIQITSNITDAQSYTTDFSENRLSGTSSPFLENYRTSKARVCVTVAMMTTGYDCPDLLNVVLMRPIMSAIDFIQIKGRGTRKADFIYERINQNDLKIAKDEYYLIDYFANYEYFENKDYSAIRELKDAKQSIATGIDIPPPNPNIIVDKDNDKLYSSKNYVIGKDGMKIDRELYKAWESTKILIDGEICQFMQSGNVEQAEKIIRERYENKPNDFITLDKIEQFEELDYKLTWQDVLTKIFGKSTQYPTRQQKLDEYFQQFKQFAKLENTTNNKIYHCFKLYVENSSFADCVNHKRFTELTQMGLDTSDLMKVGADNFAKMVQFASSQPKIFNLRK